MTIKAEKQATELTLFLEGRLDTNTSPLLEEELQKYEGEITNVVLNFKDLEYISSAGLRVLLSAQKQFKQKGSLIIKNVCEEVMEVFEITGFSDILTIK